MEVQEGEQGPPQPATQPREPATHVLGIHSFGRHFHALQTLGNDGHHLQLSFGQEPIACAQVGGPAFVHVLQLLGVAKGGGHREEEAQRSG